VIATDPLDELARIWCERWIDRGGDLIVDATCDNIQISMSMDTPPQYRNGIGDHVQWHNGCHVGHYRELEELARLVPGLREALIHHVASSGYHYSCGTSMMTRAA
jgi:hypothetical protein